MTPHAPPSRLAGMLILLSAIVLGWTGRAPADEDAPPTEDAPPATLGNLGPTGLEVGIRSDRRLIVTAVQPGSPAHGLFQKNDLITAINGLPPSREDPGELFGRWKYIADFITRAEATDGLLRFRLAPAGGQTEREVTLQLPVLGAYDPARPWDSDKARKIVRANADYIARQAGPTGQGLIEHNLYNGFAILMLLSTGEEGDLEVVRRVYQARMAKFTGSDTGPHTWHNGLQGVAVCEYYLRTGDPSVMPLINAVCESARKYLFQGGWNHWNPEINPQYTAGGLMNAAGTQVLTTLLLARQCGANVDEKTLRDSLTFFYRFAGHGSNPYGDHRPEIGYGSNNGKTEMLALAMNAAARAQNGEVYARARDKCALTALYNYPHILQGHTGGYGALWHGPAAALMCEKMPGLYATRFEHLRWFYELSRRHDGSFGASGAARYDDTRFGYAVGLGLTAPRKTLQITGAPASPFAKPFRLPDRPWGRPSDLAFFSLQGGPAYRGSDLPPHVEFRGIADADRSRLTALAAHPEQVFREQTAAVIRQRKDVVPMVEELLASDDPLARQTACMTINGYEPWGLRFSIGTRARFSLAPDEFTPRMFEGLMNIITGPDQSWWNIDQALLALAAATPEQVKSRLPDLLPWLQHPEWWLNESACIALTPAMRDPEALSVLLPPLIDSLASNMHARPRGTMSWMMNRALAQANPDLLANAHLRIFEKTPRVTSPEPAADHSGITSVALHGTLTNALAGGPEAILEAARLSVRRFNDFRPRERGELIGDLIAAGQRLDPAGQREIGDILVRHYRPLVIGDDPQKLRAEMATGTRGLDQLNKLLAIDRMAGRTDGWRILGDNKDGKQEWWQTSFNPPAMPHPSVMDRYRTVEPPPHLKDWHLPGYDPAAHGWTRQQAALFDLTPDWYPHAQSWLPAQLPEQGEVLFFRKSFELQDLDFAVLRLSVYTRQGYDVYLNGQRIVQAKSRSKTWGARRHYFNDDMRKHLKVGTNVIAATSFLEYFRGKDGGLDLYLEGLRQLPGLDK